jgi:hypothetical protein
MNHGKISDEERAAIKQMYAKKDQVRLGLWTPDGENDFVFRTILGDDMSALRDELFAKESADDVDARKVDEFIYHRCVLWPRLGYEGFDALPVGVIAEVAKAIRERSYFQTRTVDGKVLGPTLTVRPFKEAVGWDALTDEEEKSLRKKYEKTALRWVRLADRWTFVIKPLTRGDMNNITQSLDPFLDAIRAVTVWPERAEWEELPYGVLALLYDELNRFSGANPGEAETRDL